VRKRTTYRAVQIKDVKVEKLKGAVEGQDVTLAVDMAKEVPLGAVMKRADEVITTMKWKQPSETMEVVSLLGSLGARRMQVVMEPSGTYGDVLRAHLWAAGIEVYRVSGKRVHDLAEVHDGVPSHHDAKSAAIIGKLHLEGRSELWPIRSITERNGVAAVKVMGMYEEQIQRGKGQLDALLARHWPELSPLLELGSATQLGLLKTYGSAQAVAANPKAAGALMRKLARGRLTQEKVTAVLESAKQSKEVAPTEIETLLIKEHCAELDRTRRLEALARTRVNKILGQEPAVRRMAEVVGKTTAAVLYALMGDPCAYKNLAQYIKSLGLNLKETSSGKTRGAVHITKRGPGTARQYLYLAALRAVKDRKVVRAWFERKQGRDGGKGKGGKAIVAIMRKLAAALWHVARGTAFDVSKLYNVQALGLADGP
jgi:transposase